MLQKVVYHLLSHYSCVGLFYFFYFEKIMYYCPTREQESALALSSILERTSSIQYREQQAHLAIQWATLLQNLFTQEKCVQQSLNIIEWLF